jgi:muconolactone delta-isomerase
MAGTMIIEVWDEMINVELIDESCLISRDVPVMKFLTDDGSILALYETIISTGSWSTFCLFDAEFFEELSYCVVDVFRAIV